ncbi:Uncharacterised protein [Collinsella intestinalis]|nr:Uncharacterised protein [Collinsella intestinalis]
MANLLVGAETDAQLGMRQGGVFRNEGDERHDLGDAGLVVCAQQRGAVGAYELLAHKVVQSGQQRGADGDRLAIDHGAHQVTALVSHNMRLHAKAGGLFGGIEMRDQPKARTVLGTLTCGDPSRDIGVLGHRDITGTEIAQLIGEHVGKVELNGGRGNLIAVLIGRLRVHLDISQEAVEDIGHGCSFLVGRRPT